MPSKIPAARELAFLRALAETGNASLAAARAGVSRDWAYKRRQADAGFDRLCAEMVARFNASGPPLPPAADAAGPALSREGRGAGRPTRVNRDRAGGWTAASEARFLAALAVTADVELAAASAGSTAPSAYRRRMRRPGFALAWAAALKSGRETDALHWFESAKCFFKGAPVPPGNPVRVTSIGQVLRMLARSERADRRRGG